MAFVISRGRQFRLVDDEVDRHTGQNCAGLIEHLPNDATMRLGSSD